MDDNRTEIEHARTSSVWRPTHLLRAQLLLGVVSSLVCGGLYVAADLWDWENGPAVGLTQSLILNTAALLPELAIVWVYWGMARVIPPIYRPAGRLASPAAGFRGGSLCVFGSITILATTALSFPEMELVPETVAWGIVMAGALGLVALVLVAMFFMSRAGGGRGSIGGMVFLLFIVGRQFVDVLFNYLAHPNRARPEAVLDFVAKLTYLEALFCYVAFRMWFAMVKLRERRLLGNLAAVVASVELLNIGLIGAWFFGFLNFNEYAVASIAPDAARGILQFVWFYQLRERADQEPHSSKDDLWNIPLHEQNWDDAVS